MTPNLQQNSNRSTGGWAQLFDLSQVVHDNIFTALRASRHVPGGEAAVCFNVLNSPSRFVNV